MIQIAKFNDRSFIIKAIRNSNISEKERNLVKRKVRATAVIRQEDKIYFLEEIEDAIFEEMTMALVKV